MSYDTAIQGLKVSYQEDLFSAKTEPQIYVSSENLKAHLSETFHTYFDIHLLSYKVIWVVEENFFAKDIFRKDVKIVNFRKA